MGGAVTYFRPDVLGQMNIVIWAIPFACFVLSFVLGFLRAPFIMYQELNSQRHQEIKSRDERINSYEGRLKRAEAAQEPLEIENFHSPLLKKIEEHYKAQGRVVAYPRLSQKDEYLDKGFELACQPNTNREVWIGTHGGKSDKNIMMLKPKTG